MHRHAVFTIVVDGGHISVSTDGLVEFGSVLSAASSMLSVLVVFAGKSGDDLPPVVVAADACLQRATGRVGDVDRSQVEQ